MKIVVDGKVVNTGIHILIYLEVNIKIGVRKYLKEKTRQKRGEKHVFLILQVFYCALFLRFHLACLALLY
jgi:hypothetical protein